MTGTQLVDGGEWMLMVAKFDDSTFDGWSL